MADAGHEVDVQLGLSPEELLDAVVGAAGADHPLGHPGHRRRCSRPAPTWSWSGGPASGSTTSTWTRPPRRGVMVVNAPQSNILSAAEQAMALLLAQARNIPQAHAALVAGKWERSKWEGVELHGKTLGVVGLGRVGALVAQRALAFGMRLVRLRPVTSRPTGPGTWASSCCASTSSWRSRTSSPSTCRRPPRPSGSSARDLLAKAKPGIRIVNTARGGIVDEEALAEAIRVGHGAGRRPRRVRQGADHRVAALRAARPWWSPRTSARPPPRPRTRPA